MSFTLKFSSNLCDNEDINLICHRHSVSNKLCSFCINSPFMLQKFYHFMQEKVLPKNVHNPYLHFHHNSWNPRIIKRNIERKEVIPLRNADVLRNIYMGSAMLGQGLWTGKKWCTLKVLCSTSLTKRETLQKRHILKHKPNISKGTHYMNLHWQPVKKAARWLFSMNEPMFTTPSPSLCPCAAQYKCFWLHVGQTPCWSEVFLSPVTEVKACWLFFLLLCMWK